MKIRDAWWITVTVVALSGSANAAKPPKGAWNVVKMSDPITSAASCVVTSADSVGKFSFTRAGFLYPIVENNSKFGLLVGVSSGGSFRLPTGNIVWRVDDRPYQELKSADNPATKPIPLIPMPAGVSPEMQEQLNASMKAAMSAMDTSTMASGDKARTLLGEMIAGKFLIFRSEAAAPAFGLPSPATNRVGQITNEGLRPIPLDDSFRAGLADCGIKLDEL